MDQLGSHHGHISNREIYPKKINDKKDSNELTKPKLDYLGETKEQTKVDYIKEEIHPEPGNANINVIRREDDQSCKEQHSNVISLFMEADNILKSSPFAKSLGRYCTNQLQWTPMGIEELLQAKEKGIESNNLASAIESVTEDNPNTGFEVQENDLTLTQGSSVSRLSVLSKVPLAPDIVFTLEEMNVISEVRRKTSKNLKMFVPPELWESQIKFQKGLIPLGGLMTTIAKGQKAQSQYHYLNMLNQPYFDELSAGTQRILMQNNLLTLFSLSLSLYFYGHDATTAVEMEEKTGLESGLKEYLTKNHPWAVKELRPNTYEQYFEGAWAHNREAEIKHKSLLISVGNSLKDMDQKSYLLLYGITMYNMDKEVMSQLNISNKDIKVINKAQIYLDLMYKRYTRHLLEWKQGSDTIPNKRFLIQQIKDCVSIFTNDGPARGI